MKDQIKAFYSQVSIEFNVTVFILLLYYIIPSKPVSLREQERQRKPAFLLVETLSRPMLLGEMTTVDGCQRGGGAALW